MAKLQLSQKVAVSAVFVAAMFMTIIDTTIINVAVPTIGREFNTDPAQVDTVVIGFLVSLAVFIPASGWLGDRLGTKRVLLGAIVIFTAASALCGAATSLNELVLFRVFQGVGGGLMAPVGMAMLFSVFPPAERVRASAILIIPTALAPALGPVLGGLFVDYLSWRWVFYVNVPIGVIALVFGLIFLADPRHENPGRFDLPGFLLAGAGLGLFMYGISEGPSKGWSSVAVITTSIVGAILLAVLVWFELRTKEPMLDLRLYANRLFNSTLLVLTLMSVGFFGVLYLVALFFQDGLGLSALESGLNTFPEAIGVMVMSQVVTRRLYPALGPRRIMCAACILVAAMMALLSLVGTGTNLWLIRLIMFVLGMGLSGIFIPAQAAGFATVAPEKLGRATTLFNTQSRLGSAVGVALIATIAVALNPTHVVDGQVVPHLVAYRAGFLAAAAITLLGALAALTIKDVDAAATIVPRKPKVAKVTPRTEQAQPVR
ncbi:DHA2 family efflux MFS transporter permease subunit [Jatrophihabitans sp. DSM 45814]